MNVVYAQTSLCHATKATVKRKFKITLSMCNCCRQYPSKKAAEAAEDAICRFKGLRIIVKDQSSGEYSVSFQDLTNEVDPGLRTVFNDKHTYDVIEMKRLLCAKLLLPTLELEQRRMEGKHIFRRHEIKDRATCDHCETQFLGSSWFCTICAMEFCVLCLPPAISDNTTLTYPWICHERDGFILFSRFDHPGLVSVIASMKAMLSTVGSAVIPDLTPQPNHLRSPRKVERFTKAELTLPVFQKRWSLHVPLVVSAVHLEFQVSWSPQYFIEHYGNTDCDVEDCESGESVPDFTVTRFFTGFGEPRLPGSPILRLKDWPPKADFNDVFPDLLDDFMQVVPVPAYCTPNGIYNLASHFPRNSVIPDLGPKIYNAYASVLDNGHNGSTRLHLDVADAVNVMAYAGKHASGAAGYAVWQIFAPDDTDRIRQYLRERYPRLNDLAGDPIHNQAVYLTQDMLSELAVKYDAWPYVIYQGVGEAVFIPAGSAHQVSNQADCIKVTCDFVSPESAATCQLLANEFRAQRLAVEHFPDEVLPVNVMLLHTWESMQALLANISQRPEIEHEPTSTGGESGGLDGVDQKHVQPKEPVECAIPSLPKDGTRQRGEYQCPICTNPTVGAKKAKRWFHQAGALIDHAVQFHKIQLLKSQRRGLIKLDLSPAVLVQQVFKDSIVEDSARK